MLVYTGDLGLDDGAPQSVYALDKSQDHDADQARTARRTALDLRPGETVELPERARHA